MIRNAVDHGIEPADQREQAGKDPVGTICLRAYDAAGNVVIELADDGKGLDREKIIAKAVERGLVEPGREISDSEIFNLIFQPRFSTASEVTEVSGRGVVMDVVKKGIEALRGDLLPVFRLHRLLRCRCRCRPLPRPADLHRGRGQAARADGRRAARPTTGCNQVAGTVSWAASGCCWRVDPGSRPGRFDPGRRRHPEAGDRPVSRHSRQLEGYRGCAHPRRAQPEVVAWVSEPTKT